MPARRQFFRGHGAGATGLTPQPRSGARSMPEILYDFGVGRSDPGTFPTDALKAAAVRAIDTEARELNNYPGGLGHQGFREAMARRESEREGVVVVADHIVVTNGSMQGVTLSAEALQQQAGDTVIVEEFSYPGTLSAYRSLKLDMVGIPLDGGGMQMDALEDALRRLDRESRRPKFIYAISTYQNPTGFVMPRPRRLEMIDLARRFGVPIVEDNCYGDVHSTATPITFTCAPFRRSWRPASGWAISTPARPCSTPFSPAATMPAATTSQAPSSPNSTATGSPPTPR